MQSQTESGYSFGLFELSPAAHTLRRAGHEIDLAPKEFKTLLLLVERAGQVVSKETFLHEVWEGAFVGDGSLARTISVLRKHLGPEAIDTITRLGYRFTLPVIAVDPLITPRTTYPAHATAPDEIVFEPIESQSVHRPVRRWLALAATLVVVVLGAAGFSGLRHWKRVLPVASSAIRIAVLPLRSLSGTDSSTPLGRQLTEDLISALAQSDPNRVRVVDDQITDRVSDSGRSSKQSSGNLGARYVVDGTLNMSDKVAEIDLHLVDTTDRSILWSGRYRRNISDLPQLQIDMAEAASREILRTMIPSDIGSLHPGDTSDPIAERDYLEGRLDLEEKSVPAFWRAMAHFREAVQADPRYARAYAGIAETYINLAGNIQEGPAFANAKLAAQTALKIDDRVAEAHRDLAWILFNDEADLKGAEQEYRRALELNPSDARTHHWYAQFLMAERRSVEALKEVEAGLDLDPVSLSSNYNYATILILSGEPAKAAVHLRELVAREPTNEVAVGYLGLAYEEGGYYTQAVECFRRAMGLSRLKYQYEAAMAFGMAKDGQRADAQKIAGELSRKVASGTWVPAYNLAVLYAGLGNREEAFHWVDRCIDDRSCSLLEVNTNPLYRELQGDPRLVSAAHRLGMREGDVSAH